MTGYRRDVEVRIEFLEDYSTYTSGGLMSWSKGDRVTAYEDCEDLVIDWGCGQVARFWPEVAAIRVIPPLEQLAEAADEAR